MPREPEPGPPEREPARVLLGPLAQVLAEPGHAILQLEPEPELPPRAPVPGQSAVALRALRELELERAFRVPEQEQAFPLREAEEARARAAVQAPEEALEAQLGADGPELAVLQDIRR